MKKPVLIILIVLGILTVGGVFAVKSFLSGPATLEEENAPDVPVSERPFTSLTPSEDGHWLALSIQDLRVKGAASVDYELVYTRDDGLQQGVPGNVKYAEGDSIKRDLLLGSESAGKFRYDEGVELGQLTLRFRDSKGKMVGKLITDFKLQTGTTTATSPDGSFSADVSAADDGTYFLVMKTFGTKGDLGGDYTVFSSDGADYN